VGDFSKETPVFSIDNLRYLDLDAILWLNREKNLWPQSDIFFGFNQEIDSGSSFFLSPFFSSCKKQEISIKDVQKNGSFVSKNPHVFSKHTITMSSSNRRGSSTEWFRRMQCATSGDQRVRLAMRGRILFG